MSTIRYRSTAPPPRLGEWLRSTHRPRHAYLVVGIEDKGPVRIGQGRVGLGGARVYKLTVERRRADAPPDGDVVHPIFWDRRK